MNCGEGPDKSGDPVTADCLICGDRSSHADDATELHASDQRRGCSFLSAAPWRPQTNSLTERMVGRVKEGGRSYTVLSGLFRLWWAFVCVFSCLTRDSNVVDGDCSYNRRHETGQFKNTAETLPVSPVKVASTGFV